MAQLKDLIVNGPSQFIGDANFSSLNISNSISASSAIIASATITNLIANSITSTDINVTSATITNLITNSITSTDINVNNLTATTANITNLNTTAISISSNSNIGSTNLPIYWNEGVPTTITDLVLNGDITSNNISTTNITIGSPREEAGSQQSSRIGKIYFTIEEDNGSPLQSQRYSYLSMSSIGASTLPIYWSNGIPTSITGINLSSGSIIANDISVTSISVTSISVTSISANSISANSISANSISANSISVTSIFTENIFSQTNISYSNMCYDISFITSISENTINSTSTIGSTSQPIYWNQGKPGTITSMSISGGITANNKIDGVKLSGDIIHYGTCNTTSSHQKVVTCSGFSLTTGAHIIVKFTANNTFTGSSAIQLIVNNGTSNLTAKSICHNGAQIQPNLLKAGAIYNFVYDGTYFQLVGGAGGTDVKTLASNDTNTVVCYYITGQSGTTENSESLYKAYRSGSTANTTGIYFTAGDCVLMGAAWNDYAEFRRPKEKNIEPGRVVKEIGDGTMSLSTQRLERGCEIVSDTYGFSIGKSDAATLPIAVTGRVLAYPDKGPHSFTIGAPVCSGPNGTVSEMTEEEEAKYPSRIIGTVSEIPNYEVWHGANDVEVNGRIWIRIR